MDPVSLTAGLYMGMYGFAGFSTLTTQSDPVEYGSETQPGVSLVLGKEWSEFVRTDAELTWASVNLHGCNPDRCPRYESSDGNGETIGLLTNLWFQTPELYRTRLYAGGGIGPAWTRLDGRSSWSGTKLNDHGFAFAWQSGGGAQVRITDQLRLDLTGRYLDTDNFAQIRAGLGLVYEFGAPQE